MSWANCNLHNTKELKRLKVSRHSANIIDAFYGLIHFPLALTFLRQFLFATVWSRRRRPPMVLHLHSYYRLFLVHVTSALLYLKPSFVLYLLPLPLNTRFLFDTTYASLLTFLAFLSLLLWCRLKKRHFRRWRDRHFRSYFSVLHGCI